MRLQEQIYYIGQWKEVNMSSPGNNEVIAPIPTNVDPLPILKQRVEQLREQAKAVDRLIQVQRKVGDIDPQVELNQTAIKQQLDLYDKAISEVMQEDTQPKA